MNTRHIRTMVTLAAALILLAGAIALYPLILPRGAQAQADTPASGPARTITVVGEGKVRITPDLAMATIGVETTGDTVRAATDEAAEIMQALLAALEDEGIAARDIQTSGYSVYSERNYGPTGEPTDAVLYRVMNTVAVTIRDLEKVGAVLDAGIDAGANNIQGVSYSLESFESANAEAREAAVANAMAKAEELAALNGVEVGEVVSVSEIVSTGIPYAYGRAAMDMGGGAGPFVPGEMEVTQQVQVTYAIQ